MERGGGGRSVGEFTVNPNLNFFLVGGRGRESKFKIIFFFCFLLFFFAGGGGKE